MNSSSNDDLSVVNSCYEEISTREMLHNQGVDIDIDIYRQDNEEVYIATSPSFSIVDSKSPDDVYSPDHDSCSNMSDAKASNFEEGKIEDKETLACIPDDTEEEFQYSSIKNMNTYPSAVNNVDGHSYLLSSDFSQLNNLSVEVSKTFYYVLSPMGTVNSLIRSTDETSTTPSIQEDSQVSSELQDDDDPITPRIDTVITDKNKEHYFTQPIDLAQAEIATNEHVVGGSFDQLNQDYHVSFIHGIQDRMNNSDKERTQLVWQPLSSSHAEQKKNGEQNQVLMKYDHSSKVELPIIHGQPYLQVALVNDMEPTSTSELVSTDQILGVTVPELFTCKWEGCATHFLTRLDLVKHVNGSHLVAETGGVRYTCFWKGCIREGKQFDARYKMLIHLRTHTGEKPHTCLVDGCTAAFSRIENLKIHLRTHTGERPYPCLFDGCDKSFANSSDRFKHRRTHAERKPYKCSVNGCEKSYTDPSSLRKHKKRHVNTDMKKL